MPVPQYITSQEQARCLFHNTSNCLWGWRDALLISTNFRIEYQSNAIAHGLGQVLLVKSQL
ncbi:hypothetical protein [Microcoleus sp. M2_C6]|uniref:hypothetical protein n=1 Tax=Microcoleus sp. M2_C6 TaxID=3055372 RepID=UPI002FCF7FB6